MLVALIKCKSKYCIARKLFVSDLTSLCFRFLKLVLYAYTQAKGFVMSINCSYLERKFHALSTIKTGRGRQGGGGGVWYSINFYTGRLRPRSRPLHFLWYFDRNGNSFISLPQEIVAILRNYSEAKQRKAIQTN